MDLQPNLNKKIHLMMLALGKKGNAMDPIIR